MNLLDGIKMRGFVGIKVRDLNNTVIRNIQIPNTVCVGAQYVLQRALLQKAATDITYNRLWTIWAGTNNTPPTNTDTALVAV